MLQKGQKNMLDDMIWLDFVFMQPPDKSQSIKKGLLYTIFSISCIIQDVFQHLWSQIVKGKKVAKQFYFFYTWGLGNLRGMKNSMDIKKIYWWLSLFIQTNIENDIVSNYYFWFFFINLRNLDSQNFSAEFKTPI